MIILTFDAHKLDISDEFKRAIDCLKGNDDKVRIVLNKADSVTSQQLMHECSTYVVTWKSSLNTGSYRRFDKVFGTHRPGIMHFKLPLGMNPLNNHMSHILHIANILAWLQFPGICQAYPKYDAACHHNTAIHGTLAKFPEEFPCLGNICEYWLPCLGSLLAFSHFPCFQTWCQNCQKFLRLSMLHCLQFGEERFCLVGVQEVYPSREDVAVQYWVVQITSSPLFLFNVPQTGQGNLLTHRPAAKISIYFSNSNAVFQCSDFYITICLGASMKAHLTTMLLRAPFPKLWMNSEL
ncbi:hypothetical protein Pelo_6896 [Pelomyxa schiedti]|nr:hypothetical protein Pelo_6896 [Pelomyxa schiedti]